MEGARREGQHFSLVLHRRHNLGVAVACCGLRWYVHADVPLHVSGRCVDVCVCVCVRERERERERKRERYGMCVCVCVCVCVWEGG